MGSLKKWRTRSGLNYAMDEDLYYSIIENETYLDKVEMHIMSGEFFPQIIRFIAILLLLFNNTFEFTSILYTDVCVGILSTVLWFIVPLYKIPGVSCVLVMLGQTVFRYCLHIVLIVILSLTIFSNWKIILFCLISGFIYYILSSCIFGYLFSSKRNNNIARFVLK